MRSLLDIWHEPISHFGDSCCIPSYPWCSYQLAGRGCVSDLARYPLYLLDSQGLLHVVPSLPTQCVRRSAIQVLLKDVARQIPGTTKCSALAIVSTKNEAIRDYALGRRYLGSEHKGIKCGNGAYAHGAVFAFYPNKQI